MGRRLWLITWPWLLLMDQHWLRVCQLCEELRQLVAATWLFQLLLFISLISSSGQRKAQGMQSGGWKESLEEATRGCVPKQREKLGGLKSQATQGRGTGLLGRGSSCLSASTTSSTLAPQSPWSLGTWRCFQVRQSCPP